MITAGASAYPRIIDFRQHARDRRVGGRAALRGHGAHRRAGRGGRAPQPRAARGFRHHHHAQEPARPARRHHPVQGEIRRKEIDSQVFPGIQGGPLMHVIAAKAVCFHEALQPGFKTYQRQVVINAKALAARHGAQRLPHRLRRHGQPPHARRSAPDRTSPARTPRRSSTAPASR